MKEKELEIRRWDNNELIISLKGKDFKTAFEKSIKDNIDFSFAELNDTELNDTELNGAILNDAELNGAKLNGAKLNGAKLNGAEIK